MQINSRVRFAVDPSSTCTGYAASCDGRLFAHGTISPRRAADNAEARIDAMIAELSDLLAKYQPAEVVIEVPSGKLAGRNRAAASHGLTIYAMAAGEFRRAIKTWAAGAGARVVSVDERTWTRSQPKKRRQMRVAMCHPSYDPATDKGGDASDAIGILEWRAAAERLEFAIGGDR